MTARISSIERSTSRVLAVLTVLESRRSPWEVNGPPPRRARRTRGRHPGDAKGGRHLSGADRLGEVSLSRIDQVGATG
ncbi:hypothetical protein IOD13_13140 [Brevibacterium casei]|nr:hypothetical protein [Brevibacterium casei]